MLELLAEEAVGAEELLSGIVTYHGVRTSQLLLICNAAGWTRTNEDGQLTLTSQGQGILAVKNPICRLRTQVGTLMDVLIPSWGAAVIQGRKGFCQYAPPEAVQCFREAGLLDTVDPDAIAVWDRIAGKYRQEKDTARMETGRIGERLSYEYESNRTGTVPYWIALEYEGTGYDIVSRVSRKSPEQLLVEVKASRQAWSQARFHITRHEWEVLSASRHAVLHLWSLFDSLNDHAVIPVSSLAQHIPEDHAGGKWEIVCCKFSAFSPTEK